MNKRITFTFTLQ